MSDSLPSEMQLSWRRSTAPRSGTRNGRNPPSRHTLEQRDNFSRIWSRSSFSLCARPDEEKDDETPILLDGDWLSFRARLVSLEQKEKGTMPWSMLKSEANMRLLEQQNPSLAAEDDVWAHPSGAPEVGGLLIASTPATEDGLLPEELWQAVVLLTKMSNDNDHIEGLVLNRPTGLTMKRLPLMDAATGRHSRLCNSFQDERVYFGGRSHQELVQMVHGYSDIHQMDRTRAIRPGVYLGEKAESFDAACDAVEQHSRLQSGFKFFCGRLEWNFNGLRSELESGTWYCAACSRTLILKQCLSLPVPLWCETLRLMGGDYAAEAHKLYPDI